MRVTIEIDGEVEVYECDLIACGFMGGGMCGGVVKCDDDALTNAEGAVCAMMATKAVLRSIEMGDAR